MRFKRIIPIILALSLLISLLTLFAAADNGVVILKNDDFTSGITINKAANNKGDGSYPAQSKMVAVEGADGGKYGVFSPTLTGKNPGHSFIASPFGNPRFTHDSDLRFLVYEFDICTETQYTSGMNIELITKIENDDGSISNNFVSTAKITENSSLGTVISCGEGTAALNSERGAWQHVAMVIDAVLCDNGGNGSVDSMLYLYVNGRQIGKKAAFGTKSSTFIDSVRFSLATNLAVDITDTICIDNVRLTKLTHDYSGNLASVIANSSADLSEASGIAYCDNYQFPKTRTIASIGDKHFSTVSEIEAACKSGDTLTVVNDILDTLTVPCEMSIYNPNGKKLSYDAGGFEAYETEDTVTFIADFEPIDVIFHIGDETKTVTYTSPVKITPIEYDTLITVDGIQRRAIGFSNEPNGSVLTDLGIASNHNREFWLVYTSPTAYAEHSDKTRSYAFSDADVDALISGAKDGDTIRLLKNAEIHSSHTATFTITGKAVTIDLSGYTLMLSNKCASEIFTVGANGSLTIKNGTVDMLNNGRTLEASSTVQRKRLFATAENASGARIYATELDISMCKMLAYIRGGAECVFTDCNIDFTKDYDNMVDIYPNNSDIPTTLTFTRCSISALKTVINTFRPSSVSKHNTVINMNDCDITTPERIITLESLGEANISGGRYDAKYFFGKENANEDSVVSISPGTEFAFDALSEFDSRPEISYGGGALARQNDGAYPYTVADQAVNITWVISPDRITEPWALGEMPVCPINIPSETSAVRYTFGGVKTATEDVTYTLVTEANFTLGIKAVLGTDMSLNVYVPDVDFSTVRIGLTNYSKTNSELVLLDGAPYYRFNTGRIAPEDAANEIRIRVTALGYDGNVALSSSVSLVGYIEKLLLEAPDTDTYMLALSMLSYIEQACGKDGYELEEYFEKYNTDTVKLPAPPLSEGDVSSIISSVALEITRTGTFVRFTFSESFTGVVSFSYDKGGRTVTDSKAVVSGKIKGSSTYDISGDASIYLNGITVSCDGVTGMVGIDSCITEENGRLIDALYTYGKYAYAYIAGKARS